MSPFGRIINQSGSQHSLPQEKIGAVLVTVNTSYRAQELEYLLQQSDTTTLILTETFKGTSYLDILNEILPELKIVKKETFNLVNYQN